MGKLLYGPLQRDIEIEDRALAHLKVVILSKLRRNETFAFSWDKTPSQGSGRGTIWLSPAITLEFAFYGSRRPSLNRRWIQEMSNQASNGDLSITEEPPEPEGSPQDNHGRW